VKAQMLETDIKYFYNKNVKLSQRNGKCCNLSGYITNYDLAVAYGTEYRNRSICM